MEGKNISLIEKEAGLLYQRASLQIVDSQETYESAGGFIKNCMAGKKKIEEFFSPTIEQFKKAKAEAEQGRKNEIEKMEKYLKPINMAIDILRSKCKAFEDEQLRKVEIERKRLEEEAKKKADEERDRVLELAEQAKTPQQQEVLLNVAINIQEKAVEAPKPEIIKVTNLGISRRWRWKIKDESLIPKKYWILNEIMINKEVTENKEKTNIPGIEAYKE